MNDQVAGEPGASASSPSGKKGHFSLAEVRDHWYVGCTSAELEDRPIARTISGIPLVLFRGEGGRPTALLDRCAHRNVPLSLGRCVEDRVQCAYHGWEFDRDGVCQRIPALSGPAEGKARRVPVHPTLERHGFVWVYPTAGATPEVEPFPIPLLDDPRYTTVRYDVEMEAPLYATLENTLDVPHTAFLHRGLFRGGKKNAITAVVRRFSDRAEVEYVGEPRPSGLVGRLLAPQGGTVTHFDRFILPSIAQVEYALGKRSHLVITNALTPVSDFKTRLYAVVTFRLPVPGALVKLGMTGIVKSILRQDSVILKIQTETVQRFGGEQYVSTDVDLLGAHMLRLLRQAERGVLERHEGVISEQRIELLA